MTTAALQNALDYANAGIPAFPIVITWDPEKQKTNKQPLTPNGFKDATTDTERLERLFDRAVAPDAVLAVGLHPGPAGYIIVDLDISEVADGIACWQDLCAAHGQPGDVPTVMTASGGLHLWFAKPDGANFSNAHDLGAGIDVRADDGFVVAPGTTTPWGDWEWDGAAATDTKAPELPPWATSLVHAPGTSGNPAERNITLGEDVHPADLAAIQALQALGGHGLYRRAVNRPDGATVTCYYVTRPGKIAGTSATVGYIAPGVVKCWTPNWPTLKEGKVYEADQLAELAELAGQPAQTTGRVPADHRAELKAATLAKFLTGSDVLELPPPTPMVGEWLDRGVIASMPGKFGSGKSFMLLDLALSVASSVPWYGEPIEHTGPVWYVIAEGAYTAADRVRAWAEQHGTAVPDEFMIYPYRFDLADNGESWAGLRWLLEDHIEDGMTPPALIVLDTYSQLTSGDEKPETTKAALEAMYVLRDISEATVIFAHHTGHKTEGRGRGDSTLEDNIDVVFPIHGRLHDENGRLVPVKLTNTKQKSRAAQQPKWLKLQLTDGGLPYLVLAAGPDPDHDAGPRPLEKLLQYITEHPGQYSSRELSRSDEPAGIAGLGIPQRDRGQLVLQLLRLGAIEVCGKDGRRDLLGPTGVDLLQVEKGLGDDEF